MVDMLLANVEFDIKCKQLMKIKQPYAVKYCLKMASNIKDVSLMAADMRLDDEIDIAEAEPAPCRMEMHMPFMEKIKQKPLFEPEKEV